MGARLFRMCVCVFGAVLMLVPAVAAAQATPPTAKLLVTVVDPTGAVLPNAVVTITGVEAATKAATLDPAKADDKGQATIDKLVPGRYTIKGEFPGFNTAELKEQRLRAGENKHVLVLPLKGMTEGVVVGRDAREVATDRTMTFGSVLTREQIQALSDDPDEMRRQLMEMAGPDAQIKVDSFEGQQLPSKAQIKSIRISRDQFAAENHGPFHTIDIVTQPGIGPLRTNLGGNFADSALDGKNPLINAKGPSQNRGGNGSIGGTLIKDKMDFSVGLNGSNFWSTPQQISTDASGREIRKNLDIRQPRYNTGVNALVNYAVTKDQTIRFGMNVGQSESKNLGVGAFDYIERAYSTENRNWGVRFQEVGPLGRRFVTQTRFQMNASSSDMRTVTEAPTIIVQDAFTSGGAQRKGGSESKNFSFNQDLDYIRGLHSFRGGVMVDGGFSGTTLSTNYLGTYTFESLEAFQQGRPRSYSRRIGDPTLEYWNIQTAFYIQDDWRPRKNISISLGMRYQMQMRVQDRNNFAPRAGFTWSPLKSGRVSVRGSYGIFYEWFPMNTYAQTLQTDGTRQSEVNIMNPSFPDPGPITPSSAPTNRYLLEDEHLRRLPMTKRASFGLSGSFKRLSAGGTYAYNRTSNVLVGENLNAPVNGVRPDPAFANIIRAVGLAERYSHNVSGNVSLNLAPGAGGPMGPMAAPATQKFFSPRRGLSVFTYFGINRSRSTAEGAFSVPATGDLSQEWGPSGSPWNASISISSQAFKNFSINYSVNANAGSYYTIRTGKDDNGDLIFNDRPIGVGRNTERGSITRYDYMSINYSLGFGRQSSTATTAFPGGPVMIMERGGAVAVTMGAPGGASGAPRYRLNFNVSINNPTNRANYFGYSGVMTSPFFKKPISLEGVRTVSFRMGLSF